MNPYNSLCDDFGVYVYVNTKMELPNRRESVLGFFDSLRKSFPQMTDFECRESGEYVLEEDREQGNYRWVSLETKRFCSGYVNPPDLEAADAHHERVLEIAPYHLDFSPLDCEALDVLFSFDFTYQGNHDEVVAEALGLNTTLENLVQMPGTKVINYEAVPDAGPGRSVPAPVPAVHRDADQRLPDSHRPVSRSADQRLLHRAAILGPAGK